MEMVSLPSSKNNMIIYWVLALVLARNAINTLEVALSVLPSKASPLSPDIIKGNDGRGGHKWRCPIADILFIGAFQKSHLLYDRNGEQHYNIISALHKSVRGR